MIAIIRIFVIIICELVLLSQAMAEVSLDGTMGTSGPLQGPDFQIKSEYGRQSGTNLFHSFDRFSLTSEQSATFSGPDSISHIISRVTGGELSNIDGVIGSTIPGADLFLLNPSGIFLGPNARLNLQGSFTAGTSNYLSFENGDRFYTTPIESELLSSAAPSAFGFLPGDAAPIQMEGAGQVSIDQSDAFPGLVVPEGESLSLIGGDIEITNGTYVIEETIDRFGQLRTGMVRPLGGLSSPEGRINLVSVASQGEVSITDSGVDVGSVEAFGDVTLSDNARLDTSGSGSGDIYIRAGRFVASGAVIQSETRGDKDGGVIDIQADELIFTDGASIETSSFGSGNAGDIVMKVAGDVVLQGGDTTSGLTSILGNALGEEANAGNGGLISIDADNISIENGAFISSVSLGPGQGGDIRLSANDTFTIEGFGEEDFGRVNSGIVASTFSREENAGSAGNVNINAPSITILNYGLVESVSYGMGRGGDMTLTGETIFLGKTVAEAGGGQISTGNWETSTDGAGGNINIKTHDLTILDGGAIRATASGPGAAGTIDIEATGTIRVEGTSIIGGGSTIESASRSVPATHDLFFNEAGQVAFLLPLGPGEQFTGDSSQGQDGSSQDTGGGQNNPVEGTSIEQIDLLLSDYPELKKLIEALLHNNPELVDPIAGLFLADPELVDDFANLIENNPALVDPIGGLLAYNPAFISIIENLLSNNPDAPSIVGSNAGPAGNITISAENIVLENGGLINTSTEAPGVAHSSSDAGEINITTGSLSVSGVNPRGEYLSGYGSGIYSRSLGVGQSAGNAGKIYVEADTISLTDGGLILSDATGSANSGNIEIHEAGTINISGMGPSTPPLDPGLLQIGWKALFAGASLAPLESGIFSSAWSDGGMGNGLGGTITLDADTLNMREQARIATESLGAGNAGNVYIQSFDSLLMSDSATISTQAVKAGGGIIDVEAAGRIHMTDATMTTSVQTGGEDGGDITITDPRFLILNESRIQANAEAGDGGNIFISTDSFIPSIGSVVEASSETGIDGQILIDSPDTNLTGDLASLPVRYLDAGRWAKKPCDERYQTDISRFEISPPEAVFAPLDDFQDIMPDLDDLGDAFSGDIRQQVQAALAAGDFAVAAEILSCQKTSLFQSVWMSYTLNTLGKPSDAQAALTAGDIHFQGSSDKGMQALYLGRSGELALFRGEKRKAIRDLKRGVKLAAESDLPIIEACLLNSLGNLRVMNGDLTGAGLAYEQSTDILANASPKSPLLPTVMINSARLALEQKHQKSAIYIIEETIPLLKDSKTGYQSACNWIRLFHVARQIEAGEMDDRLSDEITQGLASAAACGMTIENSRLTSNAFGCLGWHHEILMQYEDALSDTRKAAHRAQTGLHADLLYRWHWQLGRLNQVMGDTRNAVTAYKNAIASLNPIRMAFLKSFRRADAVFNETVRPAYLELASIFLEHPDLLAEARDTMELLKKAELQNFYQDECMTDRNWQQFDIAQIPSGTAICYPISFSDRVSLLWMSNEGMKHFNIPVPEDQLADTINRFRKGLEEKDENVLQEAETLYDWLIRPYTQELSHRNINTLIIIPDGMLRTLPFSALYDGERFLIETFAIATIPAVNLINVNQQPPDSKTALLSGLSLEKDGFVPLPNVKKELSAIGDIMDSKILLDQEFTQPNLESEITARDYNILHMATHAVFGNRAEYSFLLTYDGKLHMDELEQLVGLKQYRVQPLDLLILSACETAIGDERASFGLAGVALRAGAKSTIASLWKTDDQAAFLLIEAFYKEYLQTGCTKAQALQSAQQKLLVEPEFAHPGYWAAFILIGNWQ